MNMEEKLQEEETVQQETEEENTENVEENTNEEESKELESAEENPPKRSILPEGMTKKKKKKDKLEEKRTEKEKSHMYEVGARDIIEKILPVVDNFERGLASVPQEEKENPVIEGMDKIYKQLITVLTDLGVAPIEAVGQEFDPNFHNAVMHVEDEELGEHIIAEEFRNPPQHGQSRELTRWQ